MTDKDKKIEEELDSNEEIVSDGIETLNSDESLNSDEPTTLDNFEISSDDTCSEDVVINGDLMENDTSDTNQNNDKDNKNETTISGESGDSDISEDENSTKSKAISSYRTDETPEERYDRKIHELNQKRKIRNIVSGLVLAIVASLIIFFIGKYRKSTIHKIGNDNITSTNQTSDNLNSSTENSENIASSDKTSNAAESSSENKKDPSYLYEGSAMPKANTGDTVQNSNGTRKNHNKSSSVYAYKVDDVKDAMYNGKELAGGKKIAFLTYDDGLSTESTPILLDLLKKEGVPATFFCLGSTFVERNKPSLERIFHEGHALAFHSFDHSYKKLYPGRKANVDEIVSQCKMSQQALDRLFGFEIPVSPWRYPGGHMSWKELEPADNALKDLGVSWIDWNTMTGDAEGKRSPKDVQGQVNHIISDWKAYASPKVITILMHDVPSKQITRDAVGEIVKRLRAEGFSFGILE